MQFEFLTFILTLLCNLTHIHLYEILIIFSCFSQVNTSIIEGLLIAKFPKHTDKSGHHRGIPEKIDSAKKRDVYKVMTLSF